MLIRAEVSCGEDFCEQCGDCLVCYGDDSCWAGGTEGDHEWPMREATEDEIRELDA